METWQLTLVLCGCAVIVAGIGVIRFGADRDESLSFSSV